MAKAAFHEIFVIGRNGFPLDSLRRQQCWPSTVLDANNIAETHKEHRRPQEIPYVVRLTGTKAQDAASWAKTGWTPISREEAEVIIRLNRA